MTIAPLADASRTLEALSVETVLGGYALLEPIGAGGTATVWRARGADGREVAVKRLHVPLADAVARRRFARERELLERVGTHPAIVALLASGVSADGTGWYATPLHAFDLDAALDGRVGTSPAWDEPGIVATLGLRLSAALAHAHARGVLHGDIKPANVLLDGAPGCTDAVLADFGAGLHVDATLTRVPGLSLAYAAPERIAGGPPSVATDLYGLGATLRRVAAIAPPSRGSRAELDAALDALVAPRPLDRPASARAAFERFAAHAPQAVRAALPPIAAPRPAPSVRTATRTSTRPVHPDGPRFESDRATSGVVAGAALRGGAWRAGRGVVPLAIGALVGGVAALAMAHVLAGRPSSLARSGLACPDRTWLCDGFDAGWGDWEREVDPATADFRLVREEASSGTVLRRVPGTRASVGDDESRAASGASSVSHAFVAPVGATLRVVSRIRIEPSGGEAHGWSNLVLLQTPAGDVWSVNVGSGYTGDDRVAFDAYRHDPTGAHDRSVAPGVAYGTGQAFCLEARLEPIPDGLAFEYRVDGLLAGRFEHPARAGDATPGEVERWYLTLGGPSIDGATPSVTWHDVLVDAGEGAPGCAERDAGSAA